MLRPNVLLAATLGLALLGAGLLAGWWRQAAPLAVPASTRASGAEEPVRPEGDATKAEASIATPAPLDTWLAGLAQDLARGSRPREAVLTFKDEAALQRFLAAGPRRGLDVVAQLARLRAVRVRFDDLGSLRDELRGRAGDLADLAGNALITLPTAPPREERPAVAQVPFGNDTLAFLGAGGDRSGWGRGATIAILDTGVGADATFGLGRLTTLDLGLGSAPGTGPHDGHGTAVAALAAGAAGDAPGVAPAANLLSIRVTDTGGASDLFTVAQAIVAAVDAGARILNISLGGYATGAVLDAALAYASRQGAVVVAAAGNDQASRLAWPAADPRVISVGAVDRAEQQVAFSNSGEQLKLTAPGYGVQTAWLDGRRVLVDGTSASAPLVAGAIAALMSQNSNLSPQQAADLLVRTASDSGAPGPDASFGAGIVNLGTALNRGNLGYLDTAIASHYFDEAHHQMQFVVQNRSSRAVSGLSLSVSVGTGTTTQTVPSLAAGEIYVASVPVNPLTLKSAGSLTFVTQLANPLGVVDQVPANNRRTSILTAPPPKP